MINADQLPTLNANRVSLRWIEASDAPALFEVFSDPEVTRYWSTPAMEDIHQAETLVASVHELFRKHQLYQWGVVRNDSNELIGTCTLAALDARNRRSEVGFALARAHWKKGFMSEALERLLAFAFEELALHRLEADVDPRNESSLGLLERLGFEREGYMRERWIVADQVCDTVFLGLLRREWETANSITDD